VKIWAGVGKALSQEDKGGPFVPQESDFQKRVMGIDANIVQEFLRQL
jgi:hypothetical protein